MLEGLWEFASMINVRREQKRLDFEKLKVITVDTGRRFYGGGGMWRIKDNYKTILFRIFFVGYVFSACFCGLFPSY